MAVVVKERTCRQCGATFQGGPRAWYCPNCRAERERESSRRFHAKGRKADRPMGSTGQCLLCGKEYVVRNWNQKYCPDCAREGVRIADRPMSITWNRAHDPGPHYKERICVVCGKPFQARTSVITCGDPACALERKRQRNRARYNRSVGKPVPEGYAPTKASGQGRQKEK